MYDTRNNISRAHLGIEVSSEYNNNLLRIIIDFSRTHNEILNWKNYINWKFSSSSWRDEFFFVQFWFIYLSRPNFSLSHLIILIKWNFKPTLQKKRNIIFLLKKKKLTRSDIELKFFNFLMQFKKIIYA